MERRVDEGELRYQYLLILAYFTTHYKSYEFSEMARIMGMTYSEVKYAIDYLLELKLLVMVDQFIVISKKGEEILMDNKLENIFVEQEKKKVMREKWNIDEPYVPIDFSM